MFESTFNTTALCATANLGESVQIFGLHLADDFVTEPYLEFQRRVPKFYTALKSAFPPFSPRPRIPLLRTDFANTASLDASYNMAKRADSC